MRLCSLPATRRDARYLLLVGKSLGLRDCWAVEQQIRISDGDWEAAEGRM